MTCVIPLCLGFLHFALMFPASPSLLAGCLCPTCCCPAGSAEPWGPLGQCLTPPVCPAVRGSHQASPGCLSGAARGAQEMFVFAGSFPGSNLGVEGFRNTVEFTFSGEVGSSV